MGVTSDPNDPRLTRGADPAGSEGHEQAEVYLVLSEEERAKGFVRPVRTRYVHTTCGAVTTIDLALAETYARDPEFYYVTYCATCRRHRPVGASGEFVWDGTNEKVGT